MEDGDERWEMEDGRMVALGNCVYMLSIQFQIMTYHNMRLS
jgi:hypothetical protein